jgi:class 3 adenylate cyclase/tetratricopeptide (TPR) repeat protein
MREERKVVTALFADLVGSTELTERLDPEDAREVIGAAVASMVEAVERFGGTIKDLAGDGVLALFGAPVSHEDDAERAVLAGLEIVRAAEGDGSLGARVGIESGLVVLGPVGAGARVEYGATGDAVNTAARLQSHASKGAVLVGEATQRALDDRFDWGDERRFELKGKAEPVRAFEVVGVRERRRHVAADSPMVGRADELARALDLAGRALAGRGGVLLVVGEPGIGKSRLVAELRRRLDGARWLEGRCVSFGRSTPFLPLREPVAEALGLVAAGDLAPDLMAVLGSAPDDPERSPEAILFRALEALRALLERLADDGPAVVAIEDVHWADPSTVRAVERLVPALTDRSVLFLLTGREREDHTERVRRLDGTGVVELDALAPDAERELLDGLLRDTALPPETRQRLVETAGGNPFFLGELARSLIDGSARDPDELPTTIEKVILARLDVLEPAPREVLTAASVLGRGAPTPILERLVEADPRPAIDELRRHDLVEEGPVDELVFRHALIQEVAYRTLLRKRRRELHARAAAAIGELWADRLDEHLAVLAYHHQGAGEIDEARACHARAAGRAERLHAVGEALEHLSSAIALAEELELAPAERDVADLLLARARIRSQTGDGTGAVADLERVLAADGIADDVGMRAHDELGFALAGAADYRAAMPHLETALDAATRLGDGAEQVRALSRLAIVDVNRLDFEAALEHGRRALALAESLGNERSEAMAMDALKQAALEIGDFDTLDRLVERLSAIHRRNDDLWYLQITLFEEAWADAIRGRLDRASARLDEAVAINRRIGDRGNEPMIRTGIALLHRARGDYGAAVAEGRRALELGKELEHAEWIAWGGVNLGSTLAELEAVAEADAVLRTATEASARAGADLHLVRALGLGAEAAWRRGDRDRASELADRAGAMLDRIRVAPPRGFVMGADAMVALARVRIEQGRVEEAEEPLRRIVEACEACGATAGAVDGRVALAELALRAGEVEEAMGEASRATAAADEGRLPTAWRARAVRAHALRAAGEQERPAGEVERAEAQVAALADTIDDAGVRAAFEAGAAERLSAGGRAR